MFRPVQRLKGLGLVHIPTVSLAGEKRRQRSLRCPHRASEATEQSPSAQREAGLVSLLTPEELSAV